MSFPLRDRMSPIPLVPPCCQLVCPNCFVRWTHTDKLIRVRCVERRKKEPHRIRQTVSCRRCKARLIIKGYATSDYTDFQLKPANSITVKGDSTIVVNSRKLKKKKRKERIALYKQETSGSSKNQKKAKPALHGFLSLLIMIPQAKSALRQRMRTVLRSIPASVILEKSEQIVNQVLDTKEFQNSNSLCAYLNMPSEPVTEQLVRQALSLNKKLYIPQVIPKSHSTSSLTTMRMCRLRSVEELDQWTSNVWGIKEPPLDAQRLTDEAIEDVATFLNRTAGSSVVPMYSRLPVDIQTPEVGKRIFCNGFHVNRCTFEVVQGGVDLIIVPGLAFTSNGHRLGRGGGYYDRYLNWYRRVATERNIKFPVLIAMAFREQLVNEIPIEQHDNTMDRLFSD